MHDILIGFINDWSRKVMAFKVFLIVKKNEYIHKQNMSIPKSAIYELQASIIVLMRQ